MSKLNRDIIYLILQELQEDKKSLYSCISVDKTWCEIIIPILWSNPWKYLKIENYKLLFNVIISHSSNNFKNNFSNQKFNFLKDSYQKPLFNYLNFCKHLNLSEINRLINSLFEGYEISTIRNEILNLFVNENTKFTHLYLPYRFDYQIHLIPGAEKCFSDLKFLSCSVNINDNALTGLVEICKSIKELELFIEVQNNNYGIVQLIETPKKLSNVRFLIETYSERNEPFYEILEKSLIKHANHIQYFKITKQPSTKILSSFVNLKSLELFDKYRPLSWDCLDNLSFPSLQSLKARSVPIKVLTNIIANTVGYLDEIKIDHTSHNEIGNKLIIQAIYKNCPNLKFLKLLFKNSNILELEKLLISCQHLNGLFIIFEDVWDVSVTIDYNHVFEILTKSSPISLFKFKFHYNREPKLKSFRLFFDNWEGRHPMLLQTVQYRRYGNEHFNLIESYKTKGIVEKYDNFLSEDICEVFKWV
ncbi:hypothetical protein RclHR1_01810009 [Rhizophagus clarus]|uniref:F-box domain-containing protein n=1 Tax=Rhizophagus clarus TaxID=94130 RepID=A0A2Z6REK9_9GLOM|nr:hypothetical protein RclHR1_01810009 [Rhizophagus clarus]GES75227.1 hypothetical protein GLOIN_2v1761545 [Rhizophagus clarus]